MKKFLSVVLAAVMLCTVFVATGCSEKPAETLKFGLGVCASYGSTKDANGEADANGSGEFDTTAVAVLLDAEGKIVKIDMDVAQIKPGWTPDGKVVEAADLRTKYEKGTEYGMSAYGSKNDGSDGKPLEWFEQADAFMKTVTGKTLDEAKAYMGEDMYPVGDLAAAGCTVHVNEFMDALEKAVANAKDSNATAADSLNVVLISANSDSSKDATEDADGVAQIDTTIVAAVVNAEGKIVVSSTDCTQGKMTFNASGVATLDITTAVKSKVEQGDGYNMSKFGTKHDGSEGQPLEWYAQAAAFNAAVVGKTASEVAALVAADGYGTSELTTAGCTISVGDIVAATVKAATID